MTLGEYPDKVPAAYLIAPSVYRSKLDLGRFENVAPLVGLDSRGPNMLGGSVFDDFNGDGRPDILVLSGDWDKGGSLFINRGNGTFVDQGESAGLADQKMSVNLSHADFDNDGDLDVIALRGGWETPYRLSLLRNQGDGVFDDVTVAAGLGEPIASQSAAWGDYDNDGLLDLYVAGEYHDRTPRPLNHGRLYHNRGNGTFENVADKAGVINERWAKGAVWGDYDDDGDLDLYVSNMNGPEPAVPQQRRSDLHRRCPGARSDRAEQQLLLLVLGLRQRRPARPVRDRVLRLTPGHRGRHARPALQGRASSPVPKPRTARGSRTSPPRSG